MMVRFHTGTNGEEVFVNPFLVTHVRPRGETDSVLKLMSGETLYISGSAGVVAGQIDSSIFAALEEPLRSIRDAVLEGIRT